MSLKLQCKPFPWLAIAFVCAVKFASFQCHKQTLHHRFLHMILRAEAESSDREEEATATVPAQRYQKG